MARGETRFGSTRTGQNPGSTAERRGGGEIGLTRVMFHLTLPGATAATAANYGPIGIIPAININRDPTGSSATGAVWKLMSIRERHETAGSGGACTLMLTKVPSGTAKAAGTACLAAGFDLTAVADTNQAGVLHATEANYLFADGDELVAVLTGTPTSVAGLCMTAEFKRIG